MKKITVNSGQNIFDICLQEFGSIEALVGLAHDNNIRIDADLEAGQELLINEARIVAPRIVNFFNEKGLDINSGVYVALFGQTIEGENDYVFDFELA